MARVCTLPAFARASANGSPSMSPAASAASFKAAMRGPPAAVMASTNGWSGSTGLSEGFFACAARARRIGQRGSQTETMRDMIVLHDPFTGASVAAAFKREPPARTHDQAEAVARGGSRADTPACCCRARFQVRRRPQQKERQATIRGGEMQPLTGFQIELVDDAGDGGRRARA